MLVADSVGRRFRHRWVLHAASLRVVPGQLRVLVGRNGAGKSTLLRIAGGLLRADHGTVRCEGELLLRPTLSRLAVRGLLLLPDHDFLSGSLTIRQHLEVISRTFGGGPIDDVVGRLALGPHLHKRPRQLSGGETRRAEVACAIVRRPRYLLADEPLRGIAPIDAEVLLAEFRALTLTGCGVVITGHEVGTLLEVADHLTWCTDGTTYELGPPAAAQLDDRFRSAYLGQGAAW